MAGRQPPAAAAAFLREGCAGIDDNVARAQAAGFDPDQPLHARPPAGWRDKYYAPLEQRMARRAPAAAATLAAAIDETRRQIELFRSYRYGFYLLRRRH